MNPKSSLTSVSKFLSLVLRHKPETIGLTLDEAGWATVDELLAKLRAAGKSVTHERLLDIVATCDKKRFALSEDGLRIRANQGHTVDVDLGLTPLQPPDVLYHGTATRFLEAILREGLIKGARHHVHLSADIDTASAVGRRYGKLVLLAIDARRMHEDGFSYFKSDNGVWLTDQVPAGYLTVRTETPERSRQ